MALKDFFLPMLDGEARRYREALLDARDYLRVGREDAALRAIELALHEPDDE